MNAEPPTVKVDFVFLDVEDGLIMADGTTASGPVEEGDEVILMAKTGRRARGVVRMKGPSLLWVAVDLLSIEEPTLVA